MKKIKLLFVALFFGISSIAYTQLVQPSIVFNEDPETHNMHLCSDGQFIYTVNGGIAADGKISKFDMTGKLIQEYPLELDMRGIMYNKKDKSLYVNCYDKNIYKVLDLGSGNYSLKFEGLYDNDQAVLAIDPKGKELYYLDNGTLKVYDFSNGQLLNTYYGIKSGEGSWNGGAVVAVSKKYIFTWDAEKQEIYTYDKNLKLINRTKIGAGDYGFSLSAIKNYVFVSTDGNYNTGTWYGYKIKDLK